MTEETETVDVVNKYASSMDSVNLINAMYDAGETIENDDLEIIQRNKDHLSIMLAKDYWTEAQDTTVFQAAIDRTV